MTNFDDIKLQVGARLQIMLKRGAGQIIHYTTLIGYVSGDYLLVKVPFENGLSVQMQEGEDVTLRTFFGLNVFTFTCNVQSIFLAPRFYMHLSFPQQQKADLQRSIVQQGGAGQGGSAGADRRFGGERHYYRHQRGRSANHCQ